MAQRRGERSASETLLHRLARWSELGSDFRAPAAGRALGEVVGDPIARPRVLSVGGGPIRVDPHVLNLNIAPFANVDVVGDAHRLPFADAVLDGVHCEAVLEHVRDPAGAVAEMYRILKPGGLVYAATPFLQAFHGYPSHFANFTDIGHRNLFESVGFEIRDSGPAIGPVFAICDLVRVFLREIAPRGTLGRIAARLFWPMTLPFRALDRYFLRRPQARVLCSLTFVLGEKPAPNRDGA
jgi:SAM-dependent methyltransferase